LLEICDELNEEAKQKRDRLEELLSQTGDEEDENH
jgi:hypothetical protein